MAQAQATAESADIRPITVAQFRAAAEDLYRSHALEVEPAAQLAPDWERYHEAEEGGSLLALGAFRGDALVGYLVGFVVIDPKYVGALQLSADLIYVRPEARGQHLGARLLREFGAIGREVDAAVRCPARPGSQLEGLLGRLGWTPEEVIYVQETQA